MSMLSSIKKRFYFVIAKYLALWAKIVLYRWNPQVVVVTGSIGKTTVLHLIEAQIGEKAVYSHHANSALGIPFYILGMSPNITSKYQWPLRLVQAPFSVFRRLPDEKLFIVEADCDRPNEGKFLSKLLKPRVTLWVSVFRTHSMNFDQLVKNGKFSDHLRAIAYEFGHFAERTSDLVIANGDQKHLVEQLGRINDSTEVELAQMKYIQQYAIKEGTTVFGLPGATIKLPGLHPKELGVGLQMINLLLKHLKMPLDSDYASLDMPPGRSNVLQGKNNLTIVDSTYNTGLGAMTAIIRLFDASPGKHKWLVIGDILEQGSLEAEEHKGLAKVIANSSAERVVLLGPRTNKDTLPTIKDLRPDLQCVSFETPKEVLDYLQDNLKGGETLLFKGGRFLEGVIEQLLANPADAKKLVRREASWVKLRQKWGLPR